MNRIFASLILFCAISLVALQSASAVTIAWSPVGNAGNSNDPATGNLYGGVGYNYNIGTYDVTNSQYAEFLNTKDPTGANTLGLYNTNMSNALADGGISFTSGNANGSKYSVISGDGNHPANSITWYDAIRFANWLNNGQANGDTETGSYTVGPLSIFGGVPINGSSITRNAGATIFLPSESEWYKAAYYDAGSSTYNLYPTSSNSTPIGSSPTALPNHANFYPGSGPAGNLTDVGAYTGTTSPYGAFDMGGNVWQWNEALISRSFRGLRGASFIYGSNYLLSSNRSNDIPTNGFNGDGFRVASTIPEPSTAVLAVIACGMMWVLRKRFK